ncbi:MAG: hypothetical protein HGB00_06120 [Chlorobiaceae bacterium]|nr:hypothetical protein [Chlorobiaceae bacterium]
MKSLMKIMERSTSMNRRFPTGLAIGLTVLHWIAFMTLFGYSYAAGEVGGTPAAWLETLAWIFGTPLMHLLKLDSTVFMVNGHKWWGDDSALILGLSVLNSVLWGTGIVWLIQHFRKPLLRN